MLIYAMIGSEMETAEQKSTKVQAGAQLDPEVFAIVERLRIEEDRSMSNMIERLLKTHPRIQPILEGESVAASV